MAGLPQPLGNAGEGHDPLIAIIFPADISLSASLAAHISCLGDAFFVASFKASQSTWVCDVSWRVSIFFQRARRGFLNVDFSIE